MRLIRNGEPYIYTHKCRENEVKGEIMSKDSFRQFLIDTLYDSFCQCNTNIKLTNDQWAYSNVVMKQQPDLIYKMNGDNSETWLYMMLDKDDVSLIDIKFVGRSVEKRNILPVLVLGDAWCFNTNGREKLCGGSYATRYETISLLRERNYPLPEILTQRQLIEKLALSWQNLDADILEPFLDKDFHYSADAVFYEMSSRHEYMNYIRAKFNTLRDGSNPISIRIGKMDGTDNFALLLHQGAYNQDLLVTITVLDGRISSMRMYEYEV